MDTWKSRWEARYGKLDAPETQEQERRLMAKLGLGEFNNVGPLVEHNFAPRKVAILLKQHAGAPAVPVVKCGDRVKAGDLLAVTEAGKLGARVHASIANRSGK